MKFLKGLLLIIILISAFNLLKLINESNYKKAINNCNGKDNVIIKYTKEGDKIFSCKVD